MRQTALTAQIEGIDVDGVSYEIEEALGLALGGRVAWDRPLVEAALRDAAETYRALRLSRRELGPAGYRSCMPDVVRDWSQSYGWDHLSDDTRPPAPTAAALSRADQVMVWLGGAGLSLGERRIVWARAASRASFADIGTLYRCSKQTVKRHHFRAIGKILGFLGVDDAKSC